MSRPTLARRPQSRPTPARRALPRHLKALPALALLLLLAYLPYLPVDLPGVLPGRLNGPGSMQLLAICLTMAGIFTLEGSSSAASDLDRIWLISRDEPQGLDDWLEMHHAGGKRAPVRRIRWLLAR